jgi:hypothetical protein
MVAVPLYALEQAQVAVTQAVQPRYLLPMVFMLVALAALDPGTLTRPLALAIAGVIVPVHAIALHTLMRRYITGVDLASWNLDRQREWWWAIPIGPTVVWGLSSVAFGCIAIALAMRASSRKDPTHMPAESSGGVERRATHARRRGLLALRIPGWGGRCAVSVSDG